MFAYFEWVSYQYQRLIDVRNMILPIEVSTKNYFGIFIYFIIYSY